MSESIMLELRQNDSTVKPLLIDGNQQNGDYEITLNNPVMLDEGDEVSVKSVYLDTAASGAGTIHIQEDLDCSFTVALYLQNYNLDQAYTYLGPDPPVAAFPAGDQPLRSYPNIPYNIPTQEDLIFRGDNNKWWLSQKAEGVAGEVFFQITGVNVTPIIKTQGYAYFGGTTLVYNYTAITPGAERLKAVATVRVGRHLRYNYPDFNPHPLDIQVKQIPGGTSPDIVLTSGITEKSKIKSAVFDKVIQMDGNEDYFTLQTFPLTFKIGKGDYTPLELTQLVNDNVSSAQYNGFATDNIYPAETIPRATNPGWTVMNPMLTSVLKNATDLYDKSVAVDPATPGLFKQCFINASGPTVKATNKGFVDLTSPTGASPWTYREGVITVIYKFESGTAAELGIAQYRQFDVADLTAPVAYWQAVGRQDWNIYEVPDNVPASPPQLGDVVSVTAVIDLTTFIIKQVNTLPDGSLSTDTYTPSSTPTRSSIGIIQDFNYSGNHYFEYPIDKMKSEGKGRTASSIPPLDRYIGTNQFAFTLDPLENKIKIDVMHFPIYGNSSSTPAVGGANPVAAVRVNDAVACVAYNPAIYTRTNEADPPFLVDKGLALRYGGAALVSMEPSGFWVDTLGFGANLINPKYNSKAKTINTDPIPNDFNSFTIVCEDGVHTTGAYPGMDIGVQHHEDFYNQPLFNNFAGDGADSVISVSDTTNVYASRVYNNVIADEGYFKVNIANNFQQQMVSSGLTTTSTQSIVNRFYTANSFTSDQGAGAITYVHRGAPQLLSNFKIQITNPDNSLVDPTILAEKNTVFVEILKAQQQPQPQEETVMTDQGKEKVKKNVGIISQN